MKPKIRNRRAASGSVPAAWPLLPICALVALAYSNSFPSGLVFDNQGILAQDPRIRELSWQNIAGILHGAYWYASPGSGLYRPLTTLSYLFNFVVLGNKLDPAGYHWVNLTIHLANTVLVYALALLLFENRRMAAAVSLIWGVHPILTECVTNIVGRADLLAAFGVFAGLVCYIQATRRQGRRALYWLIAAAFAQAAGVFAKENALILPAAIVLYDLTASNPAPWRTRAARYLAFLLPVAAFLFLRSQSQWRPTIDFADNPLVAAGFRTARLTALKAIAKLTGLILFPYRLSPDYSYNSIPLFGPNSTFWGNALAVAAFLLLAGAIVLAIRLRPYYKPLSFLVAFFLLTLLPTSNLFLLIGSMMGERFAYIPSFALIACLVYAANLLAKRARPSVAHPSIRAAGVVLICLVLAARTYARNRDWRDNYSLWESAVAAVPENAKAHNNLGDALLYPQESRDADLARAIREFRIALEINPNLPEAHFNLGNALLRQPDSLAPAVSELQAAIRLRPNYPEAHNVLGTAYARIPDRTPDRTLDAIGEFQEAIRERPNYAEAHGNLGNALAHLPGRVEDAIREDRTVIALMPGAAPAHYNLANAYLIAGNATGAIAEYRAALQIDSQMAEAHYNLAAALSRLPGHRAEADAEYQAAIALRPDLGRAQH